MMKKLAVTVFVLSLAAVGCGSDGTTPKKDGGTDAKTDVATQPDTNQPDKAMGTEVQVSGPEVQADKPIPVDVTTPDTTPKVEVQTTEAGGIDGSGTGIDGAGNDAPVMIDGGTVDVQPTEAAPAVDGGAIDGSRG
jgi:hypothetical protein